MSPSGISVSTSTASRYALWCSDLRLDPPRTLQPMLLQIIHQRVQHLSQRHVNALLDNRGNLHGAPKIPHRAGLNVKYHPQGISQSSHKNAPNEDYCRIGMRSACLPDYRSQRSKPSERRLHCSWIQWNAVMAAWIDFMRYWVYFSRCL